jgi:hypothetical protein
MILLSFYDFVYTVTVYRISTGFPLFCISCVKLLLIVLYLHINFFPSVINYHKGWQRGGQDKTCETWEVLLG